MTVGLNRRIHPRSLTDERATLLIGGESHICVVRDRSQGGARLVLREAVTLPPRFQLVQRSGARYVEVIWSDRQQVGVRFTAAAGEPNG